MTLDDVRRLVGLMKKPGLTAEELWNDPVFADGETHTGTLDELADWMREEETARTNGKPPLEANAST